jgi:hypothetical protein
MVETRGSRKRRTPEHGGGGTPIDANAANTDDAQDTIDCFAVDADHALEQASKTRAQKAKKKRVEDWDRKHPPFEILPLDVLPNVFLFLDSARDVYNLASSSKYLRQIVTSEIVVRSAVFGGGKTREALGDIMNAVQKKSIHVPSTFRLLRLVNGKKCERLEDCYAYNLVHNVSVGMNCTKNSCRPFGLYICPACVKVVSANLLPPPYRPHFAHHDRVADFDRTRLLCQPHVEAATGEQIGSIVLGKQIKQIENSYFTMDERKQALEQMLETIDENTTALEDNDQETRAEALLSAHETAESEHPAFLEAKRSLAQAKRDALVADKTAKKLKNVRPIYDKIEALLDGYVHKEAAMECTWDQYGYVRFRYLPSIRILGPLTSAPTCATTRKISAAVDSIRETYDFLSLKGFMASNFLFFLRNSQLRHEKALRLYCLAEKSWSALLSEDRRSNWSYEAFLQLLRDGEPVGALLKLLSIDEKREVFVRTAVRVLSVVRGRDVEDARNKCSKLAKFFWDNRPVIYFQVETVQQFQQKVRESHGDYQATIGSIREYLRSPLTVQFLEETGPPLQHPEQVFTRQNAVDIMYEGRYLTYLRSRNFDVLRQLHRNVFLNPVQYGCNPSLAAN